MQFGASADVDRIEIEVCRSSASLGTLANVQSGWKRREEEMQLHFLDSNAYDLPESTII
jgi:hypothetical protein